VENSTTGHNHITRSNTQLVATVQVYANGLTTDMTDGREFLGDVAPYTTGRQPNERLW